MNNPNYAQGTPAGHPDTAPAAQAQRDIVMIGVQRITDVLKRQFGDKISLPAVPRLQTQEINIDDGADTSTPEQLAA